MGRKRGGKPKTYTCAKYSPVKSCRRYRPGQQLNESVRPTIRRTEPDRQRRVQPFPALGSNGKVVPCCVRGSKIRRETLLLRGQIIASRSARSSKKLKKCDSTEEPTFPGQDMMLILNLERRF